MPYDGIAFFVNSRARSWSFPLQLKLWDGLLSVQIKQRQVHLQTYTTWRMSAVYCADAWPGPRVFENFCCAVIHRDVVFFCILICRGWCTWIENQHHILKLLHIMDSMTTSMKTSIICWAERRPPCVQVGIQSYLWVHRSDGKHELKSDLAGIRADEAPFYDVADVGFSPSWQTKNDRNPIDMQMARVSSLHSLSSSSNKTFGRQWFLYFFVIRCFRDVAIALAVYNLDVPREKKRRRKTLKH